MDKQKIETAKRTIAAFLGLLTGQPASIIWGDYASCSGSGLFTLPHPKTGEANEVGLLFRQAVHEWGHRKYTDFTALDGLNGAEILVSNGFEDPRIEAAVCKGLPGASLILNQGLDVLLDGVGTKLAAMTVANTETLALFAAIRGLQQIAPHPAVLTHAPGLVELCEKLHGEEVTALVNEAVKTLETTDSTHGVVALTLQLLRDLPKQEASNDETNPAQATDPNGGDKAEEGESVEQGECQGTITGSDLMQAATDAAYEAAFGTPQLDGDEMYAGVALDESQATGEDLAIAKQVLLVAEANGDDLAKVLLIIEAKFAGEEIEVDPVPNEVDLPIIQLVSSPGIQGEDQEFRLSGIDGALLNVFTRHLQNNRRTPTSYDEKGSVVAVDRLWRLKAVGDTRIFQHTRKVAGVSCAVKLLMDVSGSMDEDLEVAMKATLACSLALERAGKTKVSIDLFPGDDSNVKAIEPLQKFGQPLRQVMQHAKAVHVRGTTPMSRAISASTETLLRERVERHILIMLTDGNPDNGDADATKKILAQLALQGVEVMAIGLGDNCQVDQLIPRSEMVKSTSELAGAMEKLFRKHVLQKRAA